ncbi:hypothetical protein [Kineosporia sp. NBRC 101731]|uniref:hypothetical protein n=1 Tax=Kineosporia sp. NBRC 101731 TaxID=3032199 RepID=UPI0024A3E3BB|nr:hypothetical protein [Kineosporia sp. NBRC 101731]GLY29789.1 hypothetical protein Kisp02_31540 [Kineosporia sp. NBRC 101731]
MRRVHSFSAALAAATAILAGAAAVVAPAVDAPGRPPASPALSYDLVAETGQAPDPTTYASGLPWSDGGFFGHSATKARDFATWRGAPVDNVVAYTTRTTWSAELNNWWASSVPAGFDPARDDFILSVPLWTDDGMAGGDQGWKELGRQIAAVDPNGLVRLGWEMNCCFSHATNVAQWRKQFSRAVNLMRSTAPGLQIVFNPNEGAAQNGTVSAIESLYVKGKVDIIALDAYDWWAPFTTQANINSHFTKKYGWNYWYKFARARGLPFALAEFSVSSAAAGSGGDNPKFFDATYSWLSAKAKSDPGSIRFVSLFDEGASYCGCAISSSQNPKAAKAYRSRILGLRHP